jgi:TM2 domain-containing membrane protein YozV
MASPEVCPYCRMPFDEKAPPKIYCTACGMPHHEDCYQENGGCTVFGCARAPADDPKLQVSYSDLQAAAAAPLVSAAPAPSTAMLPSRYGGPLGLSAPASGTPVPASPAASAPGTAYVQPVPIAGHPPKSRTTYIVLGIFLGAFGAHNFYAGYTGRAVGQLCLSVLTLFYLAIASWIWAVVEICVVDKDSAGIKFS